MNDIENKFFEKYKELDSLCKDVLNSNQGVTQYICRWKRHLAGEDTMFTHGIMITKCLNTSDGLEIILHIIMVVQNAVKMILSM